MNDFVKIVKEVNIETRLNHLKSDFIQIIELKETNIQILETLKTRIAIMKQTYSEFIKNYKQSLFVFTLDSFHFQGKLIDIEFEEMTRIFDAILNKMYCEYYKLFRIVVDYVRENINDEKIVNLIDANDQFPIYKDLEPYRQYDFQHIKELHEIILVVLSSIHSFIMNKEHDLKIYQEKNQIGFSLDNFVNTFNFNNIMIKEKVQLFITYIEFFHKMHNKYLSRFTTKIQLMLSQVNYDIKFDGNKHSISKQINKQVLKTIKKDIPYGDRELIKEIRHTITDEDSSDTITDNNDPSAFSPNTVFFKYPIPSMPSPSPLMEECHEDHEDHEDHPLEGGGAQETQSQQENQVISVSEMSFFATENETKLSVPSPPPQESPATQDEELVVEFGSF